ncbi:Sodium/glucose cotransporter [Allorhodopirellula solitaria]|uniref:Sodium/glucose cotransporter n=1 Tax=Allorhodopirellula solitaria TaxID=2527987 RepID=A0A5C5XV81_9BACT|nr:Sodium/glucose cotransporter [Allorhodopirellula solitaria]
MGVESFALAPLDYLAIGAFFAILSIVGYWAGRGEQASSTEYFLAGKKLPWYVVGGSFIASNISSDHFIGMIGSAVVFGISISMLEWGNMITFSLLIWFFIPFLLSAKVFTTPEYLELRFNSALRQIFAVVTVISNVVAFLAAVLYGGALALSSLFGWDPWFAVIALGIVSGIWAIYGGLSSVAWTDLLTVAVMIVGGLTVTILGLDALAGDGGSLIDGFRIMIERNQATHGQWAEAVAVNAHHLAGGDAGSYDRMSLFQGATHPIVPAISLLPFILSVGVWYNVLNQFMIQRVLGARSEYDARMGIVFAGWIKVIMPLITVVPGMILFALHPEILLGPWDQVKPEADKGYVQLIQSLVPVGLRGLLLAALFGAIQSTVNSVLNSTSTIVTLDIYKRMFRPQASDRDLVTVGVISSVVILAISIVLGGFVGRLGGSLFEYIQSLYAFFAPPFAAVFVLGILWRRINGTGALVTVISGFGLGIAIKLVLNFAATPPAWLVPYANQASINWFFCLAVCSGVSLLTPPPRAEQVTDQLTFNWRKMNIFSDLGDHWYSSVVTWWGLFIITILALFIIFSGFVLPSG